VKSHYEEIMAIDCTICVKIRYGVGPYELVYPKILQSPLKPNSFTVACAYR
jgi:hypothetical protein